MNLNDAMIKILNNDCPRSRNDDGTVEYWINLCCIEYKIVARPIGKDQSGVPVSYQILSMGILDMDEEKRLAKESMFATERARQQMYEMYVRQQGSEPALSFDQWMVSRGFGYSSVDNKWVLI